MTVLDLFCCAGGAAVGLRQAGASSILGVDIDEQPDYPFDFVQLDVLSVKPEAMRNFDFIWASPPCQAYTWAAKRWDKERVDLVDATRQLLLAAGVPFVIENVPAAPIRRDLLLCGEMFGLGVIRHRAFECHGFMPVQPEHPKHRGKVRDGAYVTVAGHGADGRADLASWQKAMGINWLKDKKRIAQAVPPAYSRYILAEFMRLSEGREE